MEKRQISSEERDRLNRGWECITKDQKLMEMCKNCSTTEGAGMSIFMFRRPSDIDSKTTNCNYYYTEKDGTLWDEYINSFGDFRGIEDKETLLHSYIPEKHLLVCVTAPLDGDEYITRIHLLDAITFKSLPDTS